MTALTAQGNQSSAGKTLRHRLRCIYRLGAIALTNMAIFTSMAVINVTKTNEIEAVTALLLFPINAILNPVFNTMLTKDFFTFVIELVGFNA